MKNLSLLYVLLPFFAISASAQTAESLTNAKIKQLNAQGIDTVLIYSYGCSGCEFILRSGPGCKTIDYLYLIWADKGNNYIQRFDPCYEYDPVGGEMAGVIKLLREHLPELITEELKPPVVIDKIDGKKVKSKLQIAHDTFYIYTINLTGTSYRQVISGNNLYSKYFGVNNTQLNINYQYNQQTKLKILNDLVGKRIDELYQRLAVIKK